jgi:hypothetical protein
VQRWTLLYVFLRRMSNALVSATNSSRYSISGCGQVQKTNLALCRSLSCTFARLTVRQLCSARRLRPFPVRHAFPLNHLWRLYLRSIRHSPLLQPELLRKVYGARFRRLMSLRQLAMDPLTLKRCSRLVLQRVLHHPEAWVEPLEDSILILGIQS